MGNLYKVVDLDAAVYDCRTHCRAVNAAVGANLHIVLDYNDTCLWNLVVTFGCGGETETVGTDDASAVQDTVITDAAVVVDGHVGIEDTSVAHLCAVTYRDSAVDRAVVANLTTLADDSIRSNVAVLAYLCAFGN